MLDVRLAVTTLAMLIALLSASLAEAVKDKLPEPANDKAHSVTQGSAESRPIRVILPASWEPSKGQAETQSTK
jgi:hypothetical protein